MARKRDPKRDEAMKMFVDCNGDITNRTIAEQLGIDEKKVAVWKGRDRWLEKIDVEKCCTTKKRNTTKKAPVSLRLKQQKRIIDSLIEAGTYSPALDLLIDVYLDCFEEYQQAKINGDDTEKLRKELAKLLGQIGLDGKNKELVKKSGILLARGDEENKKMKESEQSPISRLDDFRNRRKRG